MLLKSLFLASMLFVNGHNQIQIEHSTPAKAQKVMWYQEGTGFFINDNGDLATAAHVIYNTDLTKIVVRFYGRLVSAQLKAVDYSNDIAILHINVPVLTDYFALGIPKQYEQAYILGFPAAAVFGTFVHATEGETVLDNPDPDVFSVFAKSCHGNSGGPVVDRYGTVIGILVYGYQDETVDNGLCSYHAGARFTTNLMLLANHNQIKFYTEPSIDMQVHTFSLLDMLTSSVDHNRVVFIAAPVLGQ